ncbi:formylglycine-generating enzyme family protein [Pelomonas sp. UHG3]|uniref:Formylglycine-generating enzyme family protein n=1 Tax=Roseateles hydrophilus TaxID=2975054 RepID=A0ACC6CCD2_9BURK|nr:formylglycine-generating enzyme family protein [Pelomonas sp. UHG3]MCY4745994.1 formylglycine-generating enzyme family protein [Pelomonas sp. UHG3]
MRPVASTFWCGLAGTVFCLGLTATPPAQAADASPAPGQTLKDCEDCPTLVALPSGSFVMGSPAGEQGRRRNEGPQRRVSIAYRLAVGQYEVTKAEFARFVSASGYQPEQQPGEGCHVLDGKTWGTSRQHGWRNPGYATTDAHPVSCVSWHDAQAYLAWLNRLVPGKGYRLLSEAEWEYAARAGHGGRYAWGDDEGLTEACAHANGMDITGKAQISGVTWAANACSDGAAFPVAGPVYRPNAFGLYNMAGNVWEWVQDVDHADYTDAPTDGSAWTVGGDPAFRVTRGGAWFSYPAGLRSAYRSKSEPDFRGGGVGFRIARPL